MVNNPTNHDARDAGTPCRKAWEEFRASYGSAIMHLWLLRDIEVLIPNYFDHLSDRFYQARDSADSLRSDIEELAETVWFPGVQLGSEGADYDFDTQEAMSEGELDLIEEQLFPHGLEDSDFHNSSKGLVAIGLHSSLETYAKALGISLRRITLPIAIKNHMGSASGAALDADLFAELVELDETRHLFVHHRGVVSERYVANVLYNTLIPGEAKRLKWRDLERFARVVWAVGDALKTTCPTED